MLMVNNAFNLSLRELVEVICQVKGATPVTVTATTEPDLVGGKKCPLYGLTKVGVVNGIINFSYKNAVNAIRMKEGAPTDENDVVQEFVPQPRSWGTRLFSDETLKNGQHRMLPFVGKSVPSPYVTFEQMKGMPTEQLYLEMKVQSRVGEAYFLNGEPVPNEEAELHMRPKKPETVELRDFSLKNINQLVMRGQTFVVAEEMNVMQVIQRTLKSRETVAV